MCLLLSHIGERVTSCMPPAPPTPPCAGSPQPLPPPAPSFRASQFLQLVVPLWSSLIALKPSGSFQEAALPAWTDVYMPTPGTGWRRPAVGAHTPFPHRCEVGFICTLPNDGALQNSPGWDLISTKTLEVVLGVRVEQLLAPAREVNPETPP